jgi:hypothetical protein
MTIKISIRAVGLIIEALALPFLIVVAFLFEIPDRNLVTIGFFLAIGVCVFLVGLVLHHFPEASSSSPVLNEPA